MNQLHCLLFSSDHFILMIMEITLWFALLGLVCFLVVSIIKLHDPNSSLRRQQCEYNAQIQNQQDNQAKRSKTTE